MTLALGAELPAFTLPDTDERPHTLPDEAGEAATVVVFTCNHCPYALAWHDRLIDVVRDYRDRGVAFFFVNPNDAERYPDDSFAAMKERVAADGGWPAPYLRDESQEVARAFGAKTTPDVFVFDSERRLAYRGAPDSDYQDPAKQAEWLRSALDALLAGQRPDPATTDPVGCSVKWKQR
ncbi:MAG: thioredoxin family protein [Thermoleophilum sp.]|nr:thioredoxin family protein [Thermoleophilum sp.]